MKSFAALKHFEKVLPKYIPHKFIEITKQKTVFFNVELTNEREFGAQLPMFNNKSEIENLWGVIQRPEGLHRQINAW